MKMKRFLMVLLLITTLSLSVGCSAKYRYPDTIYGTNSDMSGNVTAGENVSGKIGMFQNLTVTGNGTISGHLSVGGNVTAVRVSADNFTLGGEELLIPAYGELYVPAPFNMTLLTVGTYYPIWNTTLSGEMKGFANNGVGRMTYTDVTGARVALVNITLTLSMTPPDVPTTVSVRIYKSGVADIPSTVADLLTVGDKVEALPMVSLITLINTGDYLEIYVSCDKDDVDLTVNTMAMIITTVD